VEDTAGSRPLVLSIIIANYNARDLLVGCLESIYRHPPTTPFEVLVVDDASSDGSAEAVSARFPQVQLLRNARNVNYGASNNRALGLARGRYVYLLNNDTVVLAHALDAMIAFLDECPAAGAVGSKLLNGDGTIQASVKSLPSAASAVFGARSIVARLFPNNPFTRKELLHLGRDLTRPFTAGLVSGASVMIRREVIRQVGELDERFFYHIDADYCRRIWDAGWKVYYLPSASVVHLGHRGGSMVSIRRRVRSIVEFHRGSYIYFRKHDARSAWHPVHVLAVGGLSARFVASLLLQLAKELRAAVSRSPAVPGPGRPETGGTGRRVS
jgi:GT2 family glycosyltransferase